MALALIPRVYIHLSSVVYMYNKYIGVQGECGYLSRNAGMVMSGRGRGGLAKVDSKLGSTLTVLTLCNLHWVVFFPVIG